jgi:hypothetical protein
VRQVERTRQALLAEVRAEKGAELDGTYTRIIAQATTELLDRLQSGDLTSLPAC